MSTALMRTRTGSAIRTSSSSARRQFHHKAGELHYVEHGTYVTVEGDVNGDGKADFQIDVHNAANDLTSLLKADFVL